MLGHLKKDRSTLFTRDGWVRTGDAGYLDADGHLYFKGRMGDQIKSSGMNITPREVELVLEEQPEVMHAFVMGVPHPERGEDVSAAVVFRPGQTADVDDLRGRVKAEMSSYKVPRHIAASSSPWYSLRCFSTIIFVRDLTERMGSMRSVQPGGLSSLMAC